MSSPSCPDWRRSYLDGHRAAVNSLCQGEDGSVCSGSDDGTVRLWDLRVARSVKCILRTGPVSDVHFMGGLLYASAGNSVCAYDLRCDRVLIKEPVFSQSFDVEEISVMQTHPTANYYVIADENGVLFIHDMKTDKFRRIQTRKGHSSDVASIAFAPRSRYDMVTGGYDYRCLLWDTTSSHPKREIHFRQVEQTESKVLVPPFVFNVKYICGGHLIACALGNGNVSNLIRCRVNSYIAFRLQFFGQVWSPRLSWSLLTMTCVH